ncbi:hypothetical protein [Paenibacillus sp. 1P07SE]|uniref:hypothetical protein n=1 Tax=Paenibacillus sp. 1P07SE TaxID=3132209 RepID=UPI0039A40F89
MRSTRRRNKRPAAPAVLLIGLALTVLVSIGVLPQDWLQPEAPAPAPPGVHDYELLFPGERYPETAAHIAAAIERGHSQTCTIDRDGADRNRDLSLRGIPTRKGLDRDEWPMAMCAEGGEGASIAYISPSDNRGAGSWVSNQLSEYPDGTVVLFTIDGYDEAAAVDFAAD